MGPILYISLNWFNAMIALPYTRTLMMLTYIQGEQVNDWVKSQLHWLADCLQNRANAWEEYLYDTIKDHFNNTFTNSMIMQRAKHDLKSLHMVKDELDQYVTKFESLAELANYNLTEDLVIEKFLDRLHQGLTRSIITHTKPLPQNWEEWVQATCLAQQKFLLLHSRFCNDEPKGDFTGKKHTPQQWKQAFTKRDSNAMVLWHVHFTLKTFILIPFLLHYYHVTFSHVTPHMTHSILLLITWSPTSFFSHDSLFPLWVIPISYAFPHESLWLWWLYVSPIISDSQWFPMNHSIVSLMTLLGILGLMTPYYYTAHLLLGIVQ